MEAIDFTRPATRQLHQALVDAYPREDAVTSIVRRTGMEEADIPWKSTVRLTWEELLVDLDEAARLDALLLAVLDDPRAVKARDVVEHFRAGTARVPVPQPAAARPPPVDVDRLEKVMGAQPTFLDISFLAAGIEAARAVARLTMTFDGATYLGTGFLIAPDLVLTNHHVLFDEREAKPSALEVQFDYELGPSGLMREVVAGKPDLASIVGEREADWAIVRLVEKMAGRTPLAFSASKPKVDDWVAIVQHPAGMAKKIALRHNTITYADDDIVQYLTDTLGGSSGSPVFDEQWRVVALHHAGGDMPLPNTQTTVVCNEGVAIAKVKARLDAAAVKYGA